MKKNISHDMVTANDYRFQVKDRSDRLINYFLAGFFALGLVLAMFYGTWIIGIGVGGLSLLAYYVCKLSLPQSEMYQYILSIILGVFMAQYIYQMHGMFEMHFFAFIGSALLITYQNWKLQIPIMLVVVIHHAILSYLQNTGVDHVYFTQLEFFDLQTFIIHILLTAIIFFISGLWAYQLKKYNEREALLHEREQNAAALEKAFAKAERARHETESAKREVETANAELKKKNKELEQFAFVASHDLQEPLRTTAGFVELIQKQYQGKLDDKADKYLNYIAEASGRMKLMVNDMLYFSRIGTLGVEERVDCNIALKKVIADIAVAIEESGAIISSDDLPVILGHTSEIILLFQNLLTNAIKFRRQDVPLQIKLPYKKQQASGSFLSQITALV